MESGCTSRASYKETRSLVSLTVVATFTDWFWGNFILVYFYQDYILVCVQYSTCNKFNLVR